MTKRLIDVDDDLLDEARTHLGTTTLKDTVNAALVRAVATPTQRRPVTREDARRFAEAARDLRDPEVMRRAWE